MCRNRPRPPADPRLRGALAVALFFVGSTLLPALHLAFHDNHHDHEGGGIHVHDHDDGDPDDDDDDDGPTSGAILDHRHPHGHEHGDHEHGDGSLFHFGAALGDGAPADSGLIRLAWVTEPARDLRASAWCDTRPLHTPDARGPPSLLSA